MSAIEHTLTVNNVTKSFGVGTGQVKALQGVSLTLHKGEFVAVMGTSGSGKSTLLNIIAGLEKPNEGEVSLHGIVHKDMFTEPAATQFRRENIGFIFQSFNLLNNISVEENIALPLLLDGTSKEIMAVKVAAMLERVGLTTWAKQRPFQLSGGQQQRVAIARALISEPPILLADEPTGNLDVNTSKDIMRVLVEMKEQLEQSILLVTHDPYIASYADRVLFFHDGHIVEQYSCQHDDTDIGQLLAIFQKVMGVRL